MEGIILISKQELQACISEAVKSELSKFMQSFPQTPVPTEEILFTREQTAKRLKVTLPTLHDYTKDGRIKCNRFGRRVLYKESDIQDALKEIKFKAVA